MARVRVRGTRVALTIPPGLAQRAAQSPKVGAEMQRRVDAIAALADATCPVGATGNLRASQLSEVRITPQGLVGIVAYTEFYAHMVHNGTSHSTPNPWLLNAALSVMVGATRSGSVAA